MATFNQSIRQFFKTAFEDPQGLRETIREAAPLASDDELDALAQMFRKAINADTKKERAALLKRYRAELQRFKRTIPEYPELDASLFPELDTSDIPELNMDGIPDIADYFPEVTDYAPEVTDYDLELTVPELVDDPLYNIELDVPDFTL